MNKQTVKTSDVIFLAIITIVFGIFGGGKAFVACLIGSAVILVARAFWLGMKDEVPHQDS